jgi:hypothetical protein
LDTADVVINAGYAWIDKVKHKPGILGAEKINAASIFRPRTAERFLGATNDCTYFEA